jgi:hypothetical protein
VQIEAARKSKRAIEIGFKPAGGCRGVLFGTLKSNHFGTFHYPRPVKNMMKHTMQRLFSCAGAPVLSPRGQLASGRH